MSEVSNEKTKKSDPQDARTKNGNSDSQNLEAASDSEKAPEEEKQALEKEVEVLKHELDKSKSEQLYLRAEFDNYRKQAIKERARLTKYAGEPLITQILDVIDNFERALSADIDANNIDSFKQGVELTAQELKNILQNFGVEEVSAKGQPFDPAVHEALSSEETDKAKPGTITQVFKKAYKFHDKLIRPAQVVVAKEKK